MHFKEGEHPTHFQKVHDLPRVNLTPTADTFFQDGFHKPQQDPLDQKSGPLGFFGKKPSSPQEAFKIYHEGKEERYALSSIIIARVVDRAFSRRKDREPFGLVGYPLDWTLKEDTSQPLYIVGLPSPGPFERLNIHMNTTLKQAYFEEISFLEEYAKKNPHGKLSSVFRRLRQWEEFYNKYLPKDDRGKASEGHNMASFNPVFGSRSSMTGVGTATKLMAGLLKLIPQKCEEKLPAEQITPALLTEIARNSAPLVGKLAMLNGDTLLHLNLLVSGSNNTKEEGPFFSKLEPWYFMLRKAANGMRIDIDFAPKDLERLMESTRNTGQIVTAGCPAMVSINGEDSSIKKLWDWHVDIANEIYHRQWDIEFEPKATRIKRQEALERWAKDNNVLIFGVNV